MGERQITGSQAFRRWMKRRTPEHRLEYEAAKNEAERIKVRDKRDSWEKLGKELEEDMQGTRKLIYSIAKNCKKSEDNPRNDFNLGVSLLFYTRRVLVLLFWVT